MRPFRQADAITKLPFGQHQNKPLSSVPSDYLRWCLSIKLSARLRAAVEEELVARGAKPRSTQPAPLTEQDAPCRRCGSRALRYSWQPTAGGRFRAIRVTCRSCNRFISFVGQTPENCHMADIEEALCILTDDDLDDRTMIQRIGSLLLLGGPVDE